MNLLFDLDGTLADPFEAFSGSLDFAYDSLKIPRLTEEVMSNLIGPPLQPALPALLGDRASLADEVLRLFRQHHGQTGIYHYKFYEGMDQAIRTLMPHHRLFVVTSKPKVYADEIFRHFEKGDSFEWIYGSELSGVNSKKGDLIRFAMKERSLELHETVMIGDRKHDIFGAEENNISSIAVTWGYGHQDELTLANPSYLVKSWDELVQIFQGEAGSVGRALSAAI